MHKGCIKWFDKAKGYGFIQPDESEMEDVFIHFSAVERSGLDNLIQGQNIEYDANMDLRKGRLVASRVSLDSAEVQ
jgi:CspA family cold shock protein